MEPTRCHHCGESISQDHIPFFRMVRMDIAQCPRCRKTVDLSRFPPELWVKEAAAAPKHFQITSSPEALRITYQWMNRRVVWLLLMGVFHEFVLLLIATDSRNLARPLAYPEFAVIAAIGLVFIYAGVVGLINRTVIRISKEEISINYGPLPCTGNKVIPRCKIEQLYSVRNGSFRGFPLMPCGLHAIMTEERRIILTEAGLASVEEARFIEQTIERFWGIEDRHVPGEFYRRRDPS